jgi:DNA-damage-inducible protein D
LGYTDWRNFVGVINKAKESCKNAEIEPYYHFVDVNKIIKLPKNATRELDNITIRQYKNINNVLRFLH